MSESGALREVFAEFGIDWDDTKLQQGSRTVDGVVARVRELGAMLVGNEVAGAIREFADQFEEAAGRLEDNANALDVTTDQLQQMRFAAQAAGVETAQVDAALQRFQQSVAGAAAGGKSQAAAFRAIGVNVRDAEGNIGNLSELLDGVAAGMGGIEDPARRAQIAQQLFGRAGSRLATVLHEGEGGLAELRAELEELGGGVTPEAIETAGAYGDAMDRNKVAMDSLRSVIATALLPNLTWLVQRGTAVLSWLSRMTRGTHFAEVVLGLFGAAGVVVAAQMLRAWAPVVLRFGLMGAIILGVALVIDDLLSLAAGGESAIGDFVDSLSGLGTAQRLAQSLNEGWEGMIVFLRALGADARQLFGTDLPELLASLGASISGPLIAAWRAVEGAFNAVWSRIGGTVTALFRGIAGTLGRIARAVGLDDLARQVSDAVSTAPSVVTARETGANIAQVARDVVDEYRDIFNGRNQALAPAGATRAVTAPRAPARPIVQQSTTVGQIVVPGAGDPEAVAERVHRRIREEGRNRLDADHPLRDEDR